MTAAASPSTPRAPSTARTSPTTASASTRFGFAPTTAASAPPSSRSPGPATTATSPTPPSRGRSPADRPDTAPPMTAYVALLRGIAPTNPKMSNAELHRVVEEHGFDAESPFISRGNALFESPERTRPGRTARQRVGKEGGSAG